MFAAVAAFAAASCAQEFDTQVPAGETVTFEASVDGAETKAVLDGKVSKWEKGDKITIHNGTKGYEFATTDEGVKANFLYTGDDFSGDKFMAVYPAGNYTADVEAKTVNAYIPTYQGAREGTYNESAILSVAYTENNTLAFKNACALLKFTVKGEKSIKAIEFYGNNGEAVTGNMLVTLNDDNTVKSVQGLETDFQEGDNSWKGMGTWVKFYPEDEANGWFFKEGVTYYAAIAPANFTKGVSLNLIVANDVKVEKVKTTAAPRELKPNTILDLGELEYVAPAPSNNWGIVGTMTNWSDNIEMKLEGDWYVAEDITITTEDGFKFRNGESWADEALLTSATQTVEAGTVYNTTGGAGEENEIKVAASAIYDVYLSVDLSKFKLVKVGDIQVEEPDPSDEPVASDYGLVGSFQGWDAANPVAMESVSDGWIVAKNVELFKDDEFKFVKDKKWDVSYGTSEVSVLEENMEVKVVTSSSQNMKVSKNGKYDLYLNPNALKVKAVCVEEYTDLMVTITINNKANWSPLAITLKDGDTVIADKATVTGNKYQISGDYIGSTLTCQLSSNTKTSELMSVAISKTGATVTLEETIIKLKVQLNTDNAKKWWGNTMKIHVWNTGTSFDTTWPGNTMTSEGNYTWSIIVPSELVGKTINFLVHNGNGWQSSDSKVTIKAEGATITGSSIGIK